MKISFAENLRSIQIKNKITGIRIGHIHDIDEASRIFVNFPGNPLGPIPARFTEFIKQKLQKLNMNCEDKVLIVFENDDPSLPIIIDVVCNTIEKPAENEDIVFRITKTDDVYVDNRRIKFDAKEQIELRCGKASITLTKTGKVFIRGEYVISRSSGVNRIQGGSVRIN